MAGVAATYIVLGWLSAAGGAEPAYFWPAAGIALAALACWGPRMAWGVGLGAFVLTLIQTSAPTLAALQALGQVGGPALAVVLMQQLGFGVRATAARNLALILGLGVLLGPLCSALWSVSARLSFAPGWLEAVASGWRADALGVLAVAPALLGYALLSEIRRERQRWRGALEASGLQVFEWQPGDTSMPWLERAHPLDKECVAAAIEALSAPGGADECREPLRLPDLPGDWRWYEMHTQVQARDGHGHAKRLLTTLADIGWRRTAEERQRMSVSLFQHLHEGVLVTDTQQRVLDVNPAYCRMLGLSREDLVGQPAALLQTLNLHRSGLTPEQMLQALASQGLWQARVQAQRADGTPCTLQLTVSNIPEPDGPLRYRVVTASDLTLSLQQQQQMERQARFDALTGLANFEEFTRLLRQATATAEREGFRLSVCRIDLDQFKRINAQHGAELADALLQQVAQRLRSALRSGAQWSDVVGRLGGDEFGLILRTQDSEESQLALERLLNVLRAPYHLQQSLTLEITASIGATLYPLDNSDAETLLRHAGHALYRVKHAGRNGFRLFDTAKRLREEASLIALARVQQALDDGELRLFYQPKIDMQTGRVLGMEALLRWQHPERGLLAPAHFLPLIEQTGLAVQVGDWVIEQALKQSALWLEAGLTLNVSVNVTARQLQMPDFAQRLQELINRHPEPVAGHLSLEVLESAALADISATHALIQRCKDFGVSFALDDFGTGYSTLTYLKKLPVDALKIDRSFVQNMLIDAQDMALVEGVIGLARHFGCSVIAEGVESAAHARALLRLGCQHGQGNGIAAAMPAAEVLGWVESFARSSWLVQTGAQSGSREQGIA